ncbi:ABC transporter permease [Aeromicrobium choanae]|uniref:Putative ABC transport system permease protein n=1 Tax=Aeromicrobium choanae TaxID=1736691 RepID=A0A1T4Z7H5_9ACTN|nr:ABC transporter permease [Aeromicrobium choanae]SKB10000.1 putative ABC transport system permease protein [Aeromicrobium choanae]
MFVAWRDLKVAKGRFALIAVVVTLITVLVTFLAGLTGGLAQQNVSAITSLDADRIVFAASDDEAPSYADSAVSRAQAADWARQDGVTAVHPLGISTGRVSAADRHETVALFGGGPPSSSEASPRPGHVVLGTETADELRVDAGDPVRIADRTFVVDATRDASWYSHLPVANLALEDWQELAARPGEPATFATVLAVSGSEIDFGAADAGAGTESTGVLSSLTALGSFKSEIGSLLLMVGMLFGISALVVGAFFTVWSIQRQPDIAVLKALGATNRMLTFDALGQAAVVLLLGVTTGIGVTAVLGTAAGAALPFILSPLTTLLPGLIMTALGLAGAGLATRSVTRIDPLTALGSNR